MVNEKKSTFISYHIMKTYTMQFFSHKMYEIFNDEFVSAIDISSGRRYWFQIDNYNISYLIWNKEKIDQFYYTLRSTIINIS